MAQPFHRLLYILDFMKDVKFLYEYQLTVLNLADNPHIVYCHLQYYLEEETLEVQVHILLTSK